MVRACCVSTCHSGKNVPSHLFPKNIERRRSWLENLHIEPLEEPEMKKLRVCCKHFHDNDYCCSPTRRVLKSTAIPSILMPSVDESVITSTENPSISNTSTANISTVISSQYTLRITKEYKTFAMNNTNN